MYVVTAVREQPGLPPLPEGRGRCIGPASAPVGVQHAVPRPSGQPDRVVALCGAPVSGWVLFLQMPFGPERAASCQRCAQLVSAARLAANLARPRHPAIR